MADNKEPIAKFPDLYSEADIERRKQLKKEVEALHEAYGTHFAPEAWEAKPAWERGLRRVGEVAYLPEWFGTERARTLERFTPWLEVGFTPEMADRMKAQTESELRELQRREQIAKNLPRIKEHMEALSLLGKLTGEEAQLYELIPDLNPGRADSLNLTDDERQWFLDYATKLAKEGIPEGAPFPSPETLEELMAQFNIIAPSVDPRFIMSTVAFSKNVEQLGTALQQAYPPKDIDVSPEQLAQDKIWKELWERGILPTGNIEDDIKLLEEVMMGERKAEGTPYVMTTEDGSSIPVTKREDGFYYEGMKIANIDPKTGRWIAMTVADEFIADQPTATSDNYGDRVRFVLNSPHISDEAIKALQLCDGSDSALKEWISKYQMGGRLPPDKIDDDWLEMYRQLWKGEMPEGDFPTRLQRALYAGWGDVLAMTGGAVERWLGEGGVADVLHNEAGRMQVAYVPRIDANEFTWEWLYNPKYWSTGRWMFILEQATKTLPFALTAMFVALIGWRAGAAVPLTSLSRIGIGASGRTILSHLLGSTTAGITGRLMESGLEAGGAYDELKVETGDILYSREGADHVFWGNMKLAGLDSAQIAVALAPIPTPFKTASSAISKGFLRVTWVGGKVMVEGTTQGFEESYQTALVREAKGDPHPWRFDSEMQLATSLGFLMGAGMGIGGDMISTSLYETQNYMTPDQKTKFERDKAEANIEALNVGASESQANKYSTAIAMDKFSETEEGKGLLTQVVDIVRERTFNKQIKNPAARVYDKEIVFLQNKLKDIDLQIKSAQDSYNIHSERAKREGVTAWEVEEAQNNMSNLRTLITGLKDRRNQINGRLKEIPVTKVVKGKALEVGILRTVEGKQQVSLKPTSDLKGYALIFDVENLDSLVREKDGSLTLTEGTVAVMTKDGKMGFISIDNAYALAQQGIEPFKSNLKKLEEAVTTRERVLAGEKVVPTKITLVEDIKFHKNVPLELRERIKAALVNLQDVVRIDVREVKVNARLKLYEAQFNPRQKALEFRSTEVSDYTLYHEIAHSLSSIDINEGNYVLWEVYAGKEVVAKIKVEIGKMLEEHPEYKGEFEKDYLYGYSEWFKETEEMFASDFGSFFSGRGEIITVEHLRGIEALYGRAFEASMTQAKWNTVSLAERAAWIHQAGISADMVNAGWGQFTKEQRETLMNTPAPEVKSFVKEDVVESSTEVLMDEGLAEKLHALQEGVRMSTKEFDLVVNKKDSAAITRQTEKEKAADTEARNLLSNVSDEQLIAQMDIHNKERILLENRLPDSLMENGAQDFAAQEWLRRHPTIEIVTTADLESILSAEEIDMEVAQEQSETVKGYSESTVTLDEIARSSEKAVRDMDKHFFYADVENDIDRAFTAAWHHGDLNEALRMMPDNIKEYNEKYITENISDAKFQDTREGNFNRMDTIRAFGYADWGKFGGIARRRILRVAERATMAYLNTHGVNIGEYLKLERSTGLDKLRPGFLSPAAKKKFNEATWGLMNNFKQEFVGVSNEDLMAMEEIQSIIGSYSKANQNVMIDWAKGLRMVWDELVTQQNAFRVKYGLEPIPYHDSYVKWAYEPNIWSKMIGVFYDGKLRPDFVRDPATTPDFIKPSEPFVPHAKEREGGLQGYTKIKDVRKLFADYSEAACKDMFFTPVIQNTKSYIPLIEKSAPRFARWVMDWVSESYAGSMNFVSKAIHKTPFVFAMRPIIWLRRRLTTAVFPLNWSWNLFVQTSSIALTVEQYGMRNTIAATKFLWSKDVKSLVQENMYSHIIKQRRIGSLLYQDLGTTISKTEKIQRSNLETVEEAMNFLTRIIENNVTGLSCYAGYLKGQQLGLTGRDLIDFASDAGAKTQSMYNLQNVPGVLRSKEIGALFPFQTFCFEAMNSQTEMLGFKFLKAGTYETVAANTAEGKALARNRMRNFLSFFAAIYVFNIIGELGIDRKPWQPTSFIPMVSILMAGVEPYNPWNYPMPLRYVSEFNRARGIYFEYGDWTDLRNWFIRYHLPGGVQAVRTLEGMTALIDGEVRDVAGDKMFDVEPDEWLKAIFVSVYSTRGGEEYRRTRLEGGEPTTDAVLKELDEMEGKLGTSDEGKWYTLRDYGTDFLLMIKKEELPLWQVMDESLAFPELARFRVHCEYMWTEYYNTPEKDRADYRIANPYVDASLVFWEKVQAPRSVEGKAEIEKLFVMFKLNEHPRWHSKGLPEIPDFYKLLPE